MLDLLQLLNEIEDAFQVTTRSFVNLVTNIQKLRPSIKHTSIKPC